MKDKLWWVVFTIGAVLTMYNAVAAEWNDKPVICEQREVFEDVIKTRGEIPVSIGQILAKVRDPDGANGLSDIPAVLPITLYINPKTNTFTST